MIVSWSIRLNLSCLCLCDSQHAARAPPASKSRLSTLPSWPADLYGRGGTVEIPLGPVAPRYEVGLTLDPLLLSSSSFANPYRQVILVSF